jgi:hypothetical protein
MQLNARIAFIFLSEASDASNQKRSKERSWRIALLVVGRLHVN